MRRLWAYIIVVFTALLAVFASFPTIVKGISTNGEYETRRQFTFQLKEKTEFDVDVGEEIKPLNENSAKEIADIMKSRLATYNVSSYDVQTSGNDIVTVSFSAESNEKYSQIINYLAFSGSFALIDNSEHVVSGKDFLRGKVYTKSYEVNEYPTVIIPVNSDNEDFKAVISGAKLNPVDKEDSSSSSDGEESTTKQVARIWLVYNWRTNETYQSLVDANLLNQKTLLTIDFGLGDDEEGLYYDSNKNSLSRVCGFVDSNGNGVADPKEVSEAYALADYFVNLFSASVLDYDVKCIRGLTSGTEVWLDAKTEEVLSYQMVAWNRTLTAVVAGIIIISLLLVFFYKLGAVSVLTTSLSSVFLAFLVMIQSGLEYNALAVVSLVLVALLSIVSGVIYLNKIKEDSYKGHTLKKANTEASKKSLLPIVDVHVVAVLVGILCYALGGAALRSFASLLTIGSIISILINTLGLKGLMWLPTNTTALTGRYDLFGINKENVPDHMAEEKQTFYGTYTEKNFSKHKKSISVVVACAFLISIGGMIAAGVSRGGNLFKTSGSQLLGREIYVQNKILVKNDEESPLTDTTLDTILNEILIQKSADVAIDETNPDTYYTLASKGIISSKSTFSVSESIVEDDDTNNYLYTYYVLNINKFNGSENSVVKGYPDSAATLSEVLDEYFETTSMFKDVSEANSIKIQKVESVVAPSYVNWTKVILASSIAVLAITVYLMLRYRLSRGLASIIFPVASSAITVGIMLLLNFFLDVPSTVIIAVPVVVMFSYFLLIQFFNRERELVLDEKVKDNSYEHRSELALRALGIAYTPILATSVLGVYLLINFFGFGTANMSSSYIAMFVGAILALGIMSALVVPACNLLFKWFSNIHFEFKPREGKKSKKPVKKSAEPEEAIFIGIND